MKNDRERLRAVAAIRSIVRAAKELAQAEQALRQRGARRKRIKRRADNAADR